MSKRKSGPRGSREPGPYLLLDTLLHLATVKDSPRDLARVLTLHVQRAGLRVDEVACAAIDADVPRAVARVDLCPAEDAHLQPIMQKPRRSVLIQIHFCL